ncbi:MAG: hypothetical protein ACTSR8_05780 [Promethearchaeota archaeon]
MAKKCAVVGNFIITSNHIKNGFKSSTACPYLFIFVNRYILKLKIMCILMLEKIKEALLDVLCR